MNSVVIYTTEPVPLAMAATNRLFAYAKGLAELGIDTTVVSVKPGLSPSTSSYSGIFNKVPYQIITSKKLWSKGIFFKLLAVLISFKSLVDILRKKKNNHTNLAVILVTNKFLFILLIRLITCLLRIPLYQEKSEFPFLLMSKNFIKRKLIAPLYISIVYKLFEGMIVMTRPLYEYFQPRIRHSARLLLFPLTIDFNRFNEARLVPGRFNDHFIGYCGSMGGDKDGILDLLDAFSLVVGRFPDITMVLVGSADKKDLEKIQHKIKTLDIVDSVVLYGSMSRDEIPSFLKSADMLVLARPANLQAAGGFPSKLGEYFAAGKPVVVTRVGEIDRYVQDEKHALLCDPGDMKQFAGLIMKILSNPEAYQEMAKNACILAQKEFDYMELSKHLITFLFDHHE